MRNIKARHTAELLKKKNVVGVGIGEKIVRGERVGERALSVLVEKKEPEYALSIQDQIPPHVENVPTDVVEVGYIQAPPPDLVIKDTTLDKYRQRHRPASPGLSIGHYRITAGTFGCVVHRDGERFILSNNHVLAMSNAGKIGEPVWQPGRHDGGGSDDHIADLADYTELKFSQIGSSCALAGMLANLANIAAIMVGSRHRLKPYQEQTEVNIIDAAIARPLESAYISPVIMDGVGVPEGRTFASLGDRVHKVGRTTGHTYGRITQIEATVRVGYGGNKVAIFTDQLVAVGIEGRPMSAGGDSGSLVLTKDNYALGLLFAGSQTTTIMNPIEYVTAMLGVQLVT